MNNIRSKSLGADTVEIQYNANNQISRARDTRDGNIWRNYIHDARGNVTSNNRIGFSYDRSDQPVTMWGIASGSYAYDAHNRRVKQTINGETIYSVYSLDGTLRYRDNVTTGDFTDYFRLGQSGPTLLRVLNGGASCNAQFMFQDHLGSAAVSTTAGSSGTLLWREHYTPFGETLNNPAGNADDTGFTGHIRDTATGLTYAQARYYDPAIGRFLSNDPVGFASGGPGYFNRYAYTFNDPVNLVDPTGEEAEIAIDGTRVVITQRFYTTREGAALEAMQNAFPNQTAGGEFQIEYRVEKVDGLEAFFASVFGAEALGLNTVRMISRGEAQRRGWAPNKLASGGVLQNGASVITYRSDVDPYIYPEAFGHEAGHGLGVLEHSNSFGNLMFPTIDGVGSDFTLEQLRAITNHGANNVTICSLEAENEDLC